MLARLRGAWRAARELPGFSRVLLGVDRFWWTQTIRNAHVVDMMLVRAQFPGRRVTKNQAIRAYVRGGFRRGLVLNPLFCEGMVSAQLPDSDRVPALYAYLVADKTSVGTTPAWDAAGYAAANPQSLQAPGGPLGHAWRSLIQGRTIQLDGGTGPEETDLTELRMVSNASLANSFVGSAELPVPEGSDPTTHICFSLGNSDSSALPLQDLVQVIKALSNQVVVHLGVSRAQTPLRVAASLMLQANSQITISSSGQCPCKLRPEDMLLVREANTDISASHLLEVLHHAKDAPVEPLWLDATGAIAAAGYQAHNGVGFPYLCGFPVEDAKALGPRIPTTAVAAPVHAHRLSTMDKPAGVLTNCWAFSSKTPEILLLPKAYNSPIVLNPRGLTIESWGKNGPNWGRTDEFFALASGLTVPRLRWGIKTASPPGSAGESWGDTHFARGIAAALERLGQYAAVDAFPAANRKTTELDDVTLVLRGPNRINPPEQMQPGAKSMVWIISHPNEITSDELAQFDLVFAASRLWAKTASTSFGRTIMPLMQCTDTTRFRPTGQERTKDIVFVGTARGIARPAVVGPVEAGIPVMVYGPDWRGYIPAQHISATGIANNLLPARYESAAVVLNDHWPQMQKHGFISNRLYDVVAAGGRAISDEVLGIEQEFQGAVQTFSSAKNLVELLQGNPDDIFPTAAELQKISQQVRSRDSFDARAHTLLQRVLGMPEKSSQPPT